MVDSILYLSYNALSNKSASELEKEYTLKRIPSFYLLPSPIIKCAKDKGVNISLIFIGITFFPFKYQISCNSEKQGNCIVVKVILL